MTVPLVTVTEGQVKGKIAQDYLGGTYYSFLGIPYAKAPIGPLRFKAPQPSEPWEGIRDATKEGPSCPARHMIFPRYMGSEDNCLNLNIYTPELPTDGCKLKPVMVWIHGGGFVHGSNKSDVYGPDYLITEDVVVVCINYRLGVLGFLCLEDPTLEVPGNAGLKDMVLALKWIQKNIKNFCGDPNNVTIFGESAGGASVHYLYVSPMAKGLFHRAIAQSGCSINCWAKGSNSNVFEIAKNLGYEETDEKKILDHLRSLPAHKIFEAQSKTQDPFDARTVHPFGPVVEKVSKEEAFLTESPIDIIKSGRFNDVPLMMGYTSREGMIFEAMKKRNNADFKIPINFESEVFHDLNLKLGSQKSIEKANKIKKFYFGEEKPSDENIDKLYLMKTDNLFLHGIHNSITHQKVKSKSPIFFYKMTVETSLNAFRNLCTTKSVYAYMFFHTLGYLLGDGIFRKTFKRLANLVPQKDQPGVCHADDLCYLFKTLFSESLDPESVEGKHVRRIVKLWTNFARYGNPTPDADDELLGTTWKPVSKEENWLLNIGENLEMEIDPDVERVEFWNDICQQ